MDVLAFISLDTINDLMSTWGYVALFGILFSCGLGVPIPEDVPLILAGAAISQGKMTWLMAGICAWSGIIGGDIVLYHLGRKYGLGITRLPLIGKHVTAARIQRVEKLFGQYGVGVVAVGRLFAGIRGAMVVCAGTIRYNFIKFLIADGLAALVSGGLWVWLGHWLGKRLFSEEGKAILERFKVWFIIGGVALAVVIIGWIIWRSRHRTEVIEAEAKIIENVGEAAKKLDHRQPHEDAA